jgi:4-amino-4-deoxy-L-arabinose transferase-like glycosyltransferase
MAGILALAAGLRFYHLASAPPGLFHDEAMNGNNSLENLETGHFSVFYPENGGREGLYVNSATLFVHFLGNTSVALRLPAAIFGVLTVWGVYLLGRELFSPPIGLLASFFTATSFWHLVFSRLGLRAIAAPLFLTFGLWLLLVGLRRAREGRPAIGIMLAAGAVYGLGFHTYIAYRATPVLVGAILLHGFAHRRACLAFLAATTAVCAPLALYFLQHPDAFVARSWQVSAAQSPNPAREVILNTWRTARMFFRQGDLNWRHNVAYRAEIFWPVAILFAIGVLAAVARARNRRFPYILALGWMVLGAIPPVLSNDVVPHALRSLLLIPPAFLLAAVGADVAYNFLSAHLPRAVLAPLAAGLLLALAYEPYHTYFDLWAPDARVAAAMNSEEAQVAREINALPRRAPKVVAVSSAGVLTIQYLTRSYTRKQQEDANIRYVDADACEAPAGTAVFCLE